MGKKFELTDKFIINVFGIKLFQIKCTKSFKYAQKGDLGGYVEKEGNLDQENDAWVSGNAQVSGDARVSGNAWVSGNAQVSGNARVYGNAWVSGDARVYGNAWVSGNAQVSGDAWVSGNARVSGDANIKNNNEHCGFDGFGSCNRHTHAYLTKEKKVEITCGCFRGSIEEFEKKVEETHSGTIYEKQYKAIINVIKIKFGLTD
jgi:cytoskeletal protein CcmA (bactofilin family)